MHSFRKPVKRPARNGCSVTRTVPSPTKGWNARDSIAAMSRDEAYSMVNWYPYPSDLVVRGGRTAHREDAGAVITSMMVYNYGTSSKLLVTASTNLYDVTSSGTSFPSAAQSSLSANQPRK